jgi:hypothetical protein
MLVDRKGHSRHVKDPDDEAFDQFPRAEGPEPELPAERGVVEFRTNEVIGEDARSPRHDLPFDIGGHRLAVGVDDRHLDVRQRPTVARQRLRAVFWPGGRHDEALGLAVLPAAAAVPCGVAVSAHA